MPTTQLTPAATQYAFDLLLPKGVGHPGTGSYLAPSSDPSIPNQKKKWGVHVIFQKSRSPAFAHYVTNYAHQPILCRQTGKKSRDS